MTKTHLSASVDTSGALLILEVAKSLGCNKSQALDWILRCAMNKEKFYRAMSRYHQQQLMFFQEQLETLRQNPELQKPIISEDL